MKSRIPHTPMSTLFAGGIGDIVEKPTPLTFSFLSHWFSGTQSFGTAMKLIDIPYIARERSLLTLLDGELYSNLLSEELILYAHTIFSYTYQTQVTNTPKLSMFTRKLFSPKHLYFTAKLILTQSRWIANPDGITTLIQHLLDAIDTTQTTLPIKQLDAYITNHVMPAVIVAGFVAEYFQQYLMHESKQSQDAVLSYVTQNLSKNDWLLHSVSDQYLVKTKEQSLSCFLETYGVRGDKDFELTCPRWKEIPSLIEKRIATSVPFPETYLPAKLSSSQKKLADSVVDLQLKRTQAKQKALLFIDALRSHILIHAPDKKHISTLTREQILKSEYPLSKPIKQKSVAKKATEPPTQTEAKGTGVSIGVVTGTILRVTTTQTTIPANTIAIFPNASPEYSVLFSRCLGMIFLRGGQTSHGAIVAREYGIPAIVESSASSLEDGQIVTINGKNGTWKLGP